MASLTLYGYVATEVGDSANYEISSGRGRPATPTDPASASVKDGTYSDGNTFTFGTTTYTYLGGADEDSGGKALQVGFFARDSHGHVVLFVTQPFVNNI